MTVTEHRSIIQDSIRYIESNLKTDISASELASFAGFSLYHYYRVFQSAVGMSVMQYILQRRLFHAVYEISLGKSGIDAALDYGFDTYAGFYRAFLREFNCTPSQYLRSGRVRKPCPPDLSRKEHIMVTHKKAAEILKHWNMENMPVQNIYFDGSGEKHDRAFYAGPEHVLKFSTDPRELETHGELSRAMAKAGLLSAVPLEARDGETIVRDGRLSFCLTKRLSGRPVDVSALYSESGCRQAMFLGRIIGQLHSALKQLEAPVNDVNQLEMVRSWALPKAREVLSLSHGFCMDYLDHFRRLYPQLPRQIIHRDPNPGNILVDGDRWGFLDFDLSERNLRLYDPCYAATAILSESFPRAEQDGKWLEIYRGILLGYDSAAVLTDAEWEAVPYVVLTNQLVCVAWFAEQQRYPEMLETNKRMTLWLIDHFEELKFNR